MREVLSHQESPYSMDKVTIEALSSPHPDTKRFQLNYPFELQGRGESNPETGEIIVRFPKGDVFLSYVTTIHELGHPRQEEINPKLAEPALDSGPDVLAEEDAWQRGWDRFSRANQEVLKDLEQRLQNYKEQGKLQEFGSFQQLYNYVRDCAGRAVEAQRELFDKTGHQISDLNEAEKRQLENLFERIGWSEFIQQYESARVGEDINEQEARQAILKTVELIIAE